VRVGADVPVRHGVRAFSVSGASFGQGVSEFFIYLLAVVHWVFSCVLRVYYYSYSHYSRY
jgi:hypothetical protein